MQEFDNQMTYTRRVAYVKASEKVVEKYEETTEQRERDVRFARIEEILKTHDKHYAPSGGLGSMERVL